MDGLANVQDTVDSFMEYPGGTGRSFSGASCGALVVLQHSLCASHEVFGCASL